MKFTIRRGSSWRFSKLSRLDKNDMVKIKPPTNNIIRDSLAFF